MSQLGTLDLTLAPDEGRGIPVVGLGEVADCLDQLRDAGKAGSGQGFSAEDAEPDFHLVEPACRSWGEVEGDVRVYRQPVVVLLVGGEVVEDDMDFPIGRLLGDQVGHKGLEIDAFLGLRGLSLNDAAGHFERGEQVDRAVPFVGAFQAVNILAAPGQPGTRRATDATAHRLRPHTKQAANRGVPFAFQASQNNLRPFPQAGLLRPTSSKGHQFASLLGGAGQGYRDPWHRTPQLVSSTEASYLISYTNAIRH